MSSETRLCRFCKAEYVPKRDWQRFCGDDCRKSYWKSVHNERQYLEKKITDLEKKIEGMRP
jgi:hypothetical protein